MTNWKKELAVAQLVRRHMSVVDRGTWPVEVPRAPATPRALEDAEARLGIPLDGEYAAFLACANGWPAFYQAVDLFGCDDLGVGPKWRRAAEFLDVAAPFRAAARTFERAEVIPIAASVDDIDVFCITTSRSSVPGRALWVAGGVVEEFGSFSEFFASMVDYNRQSIREFEGGST